MADPIIIYGKIPSSIKKTNYNQQEIVPDIETDTKSILRNTIDKDIHLYKQKETYIQYDTNHDDEDLSDCR